MGRQKRERRTRAWERQLQPQKNAITTVRRPFNPWPIIALLAVAMVVVVSLFRTKEIPHPVVEPSASQPTPPSGNPDLPPPLDVNTSREELVKKFDELLDQHPDRALAERLKGYFGDQRAEIVFVNNGYPRRMAGQSGVVLLAVGARRGSTTPTMRADILIFDPRYTRQDYAFRVLSHEGYHLDRVMRGLVPFERLTKTDNLTKTDIRQIYEEEVEACKMECKFAKGRPLARIPQGTERCELYWSNRMQAFRREIAETYVMLEPFNRFPEYVLAVADNPDLP